nr:BTB domain containing protein [Pandoravirus aubagnensis]
MSDSDDDDNDDYGFRPHMPSASLASVRRVHCDCVIRVSGTKAAPDGVIEAHRAVLARAAYFAALFDHTDPDHIQERDGEGKRVFHLVYTTTVPFSRESLTFLIQCLYIPSYVDRIETCDDPVDVVQASLFLGMPAAYTAALIEAVFVRLLTQTAKNPGADATAQLGAFVLHLLASDIEPSVKKSTVERTLGMLNEGDREMLSARRADLMPIPYYHPTNVVGDVTVDEDGRRWRRLCIAIDNIDPKGASSITWQGLVFGAKYRFTNYDREPLLSVVVSCAPQGETLGAWPWGADAPDGAIDVEARPLRLKVLAYHPTYGSSAKSHIYADMSTYKRPSDRDNKRAAHEASLPKGTYLVPFAVSRTSHSTMARRNTLEAFLTKYEHGSPAVRSLVACEVVIEVQEIDS